MVELKVVLAFEFLNIEAHAVEAVDDHESSLRWLLIFADILGFFVCFNQVACFV